MTEAIYALMEGADTAEAIDDVAKFWRIDVTAAVAAPPVRPLESFYPSPGLVT